MLRRLSDFFVAWDPDCERVDAFANLNYFAGAHQDAIASLCRIIGANCQNFGQTFYRHLTRRILKQQTSDIRAFIEALGPLLTERDSPVARAFWSALCADAGEMTRLRQREGRLRSCWGVTPIVNLRTGVAADRLLGVEAESVVFTHYHVSSDFDLVLKGMQDELMAERYNLIHPFRWLVLGWALLRYDVFHLYNDAGFIDLIGGYGTRMGIALDELRSYRWAGKRLYTYTYGADHRMRGKASAAGRWSFCSECPEPGAFCICDDVGGEQMLATISEYATAMIAHGLSQPMVPGSRNIASTAIDLREIGPPRAGPARFEQPLKVGHFPNHPYFKGTKYLEAAIARMQADGLDIQLILLNGVPRSQILEAMSGLDLLVDQLISGSFGATALEGMALGLPVVCYLHDNVAVANLADCPIIRANPKTIEDVLRRIVANRRELVEAGNKGRAYVEQNYSVPALAKSLAELYRETGDLAAPLAARLTRRAALIAASPDAAQQAGSSLVARSWKLPFVGRALSRMGRSVLKARLVSLRLRLQPIARELERRYRFFTRLRAVVEVWHYPARLKRLIGRCLRPLMQPLGRGMAAGVQRGAARVVKAARHYGDRRQAKGEVRTLWGTTPILTLPILARCDALLGLKSDSLVFTTYYITRNFSINLTIPDKVAAKLMKIRRTAHRRFRFAVLAYVMLRYDAVHFFYDRGLLPGTERFGIEDIEIELLSRAGLKIYTYAYGADVRTRERTLALGPVNFCTDCPQRLAYCICDDAQLDLSLSRLDHRVTAKIAMGDMLAYVPGCRNMHYWPLDLDHLQPTPLSWRKGQPLRIAHAPNHSHFKGTHHLEAAIDRLRGEGYEVEMVKISGVPNTEVLDMFRSVSLVADQFIGGFHGYTALEAMALGRPVLCFLRAPDMTIAPEESPIINAPPHLVYAVLKSILDGEMDIEELGRRSRRFIERHYSIPAVAARLGQLYLETSNWPQATLDRIAARVSELEAALPAPMLAPMPVAWERVYDVPEQRAAPAPAHI
ncbi:MAG: glycosyltransferase [Bosea sp.]|uniref:glycosyltransferase n=1 Tax=Bosea sp. (in: a-proteobacteria) TaxID=1871050 RepID=UPI00239E7369|nr:glycosyltransferase [Bosea sp. (in: a-proteobacteria)]MCP4733318.1 glycosyltransferase [Bosea sp. (in: a-proteobacteria)]